MEDGGGVRRAAVDEGGGESRVDRDREGFVDIAQIDIEIFGLGRPAASEPGLDAGTDGPTELASREISRARQERARLQGPRKDHRICRTGESVAILERAPCQTAGYVPQGVVDKDAAACARCRDLGELLLGRQTVAEAVRTGTEKCKVGRRCVAAGRAFLG